MEMINLGILGPTGRMGKSIILESKVFQNIKLVSLCESIGHQDVGKDLEGVKIIDDLNEFVSSCDVIIDFTIPNGTLSLMKAMQKNKRVALVTGTTGYEKEEELRFNHLLRGLKVLRSSNMSLGINLLSNVSKFIASRLGHEVDIEVIEAHHKDKKDAPSGTAISLGESIAAGRTGSQNNFIYRGLNFNKAREEGDIGFSSIRGGDIVGDHTVHFLMNGERLEFTHRASEREIFARGSLQAAEWLKNKEPGLYSIQDIIKL